MILLGIETATELVGVAVGDETGPRSGVWATGRRRHTESLAPAIDHALEQAGCSLDRLEGVAVDVGPGLFTGLRVGLATAKGLAQGLGIAVLGATSLEILARAAHDVGHRGPVLAVVDARRGEVFAALYRPSAGAGAGAGGDGGGGDGGGGGGAGKSGSPMVEVLAPRVGAPGDLAVAVSDLEGVPVPGAGDGGATLLAVGDGALRYAEVLGQALPGLVVAGPTLAAPPPAALLTVVRERTGAGAPPEAPGAVAPLYLRDADARVNWTSRRPVAPGA